MEKERIKMENIEIFEKYHKRYDKHIRHISKRFFWFGVRNTCGYSKQEFIEFSRVVDKEIGMNDYEIDIINAYREIHVDENEGYPVKRFKKWLKGKLDE